MLYLNLDAEGYLQAVSTVGPEGAPCIDTLDGLDLSGSRIGAYRWDGAALVLDPVRLAEIEAADRAADIRRQIAALTSELRSTDSVVLEALEGLMTATTATGFIAALITAARAIKTTLAERANIRERIAALKGGDTDGT